MLLLIIAGTIFALLFSPIYRHRMNILFVGYLIILSLSLFAGSRLSKPGLLLIIIIVMLPLAGSKLFSDYNRMKMAREELGDFEKQVLLSSSDSVLVYPRAYIDPSTRENWARPVAEYYGKKYIGLIDDLDSTHWKNSKSAVYQHYSEKRQNGIDLNSLRYVTHSKYSKSIYIVMDIDTTRYNPADISISMYSANIPSDMLSKMFMILPRIVQTHFLSAQPEFRPVTYKKINGHYVFTVIAQNKQDSYDLLRLRITSGNRKVDDMLFYDAHL
jgi:hypothetical protein